MQIITCLCGCGGKKAVRQADIDRGWGLYYSKRCKAKHQAQGFKSPTANKKRSVKHDKYDRQYTKGGVATTWYFGSDQEHDDLMDEAEMGWDAHKDITL